MVPITGKQSEPLQLGDSGDKSFSFHNLGYILRLWERYLGIFKVCFTDLLHALNCFLSHELIDCITEFSSDPNGYGLSIFGLQLDPKLGLEAIHRMDNSLKQSVLCSSQKLAGLHKHFNFYFLKLFCCIILNWFLHQCTGGHERGVFGHISSNGFQM